MSRLDLSWRVGFRRLAPVLAAVLVVLAAPPPALAQVTCPGSDPEVLDCNANGTDDFCDIEFGTSQDCNSNGTPDECDLTGPGRTFEHTIPVVPPQPISEVLPPATHAFEVAESGAIQDVDVGVTLTHTDSHELQISISHAGTTVILFNRQCAGEDDFTGTIWSDEAATTMVCTAGHVGTFRPFNPLSAFDGMEVSGAWTLTVLDDRNGDSGSLTGWFLRIDVPYDCNINGVPDDCDIAQGASADCNTNGLPDECDMDEATLTWRQVAQQPSTLAGHAMAYDSARDVTVLFGGDNATGLSGETWEWDGSTWTYRTSVGPGPRVSHAMAYDSSRGVTVLFGGWDGARDGETWEWDGNMWTQRNVVGPSPRSYHAMAYDSARGVTVLFGGYDGSQDLVSPETWEWNGSVWVLQAASGAGSRAECALAYDSVRGLTVLYGGVGGTGVEFGAAAEWNGVAWTPRPSTPGLRQGPIMAYDSVRAVTVLYGGGVPNCCRSTYDETWEWDGITWLLRSVSGPGQYADPAMAYDSARHLTVLVSGTSTWTFGPASSDCNTDGIPDECASLEADCDQNDRPDECEAGLPIFGDCNSNTAADACDIAFGTSLDCNENARPDECDLATGTSSDCNANSIPDECDIGSSVSADCQPNSTPDECELAGNDCDGNTTPDDCQEECNGNGVPDSCDIAFGTSRDLCGVSGVPDECENGPPPALIASAGSWHYHGVPYERIAINPLGRVQNGNVASEPRLGRIAQLRITFDSPPGWVGTIPVTLYQQPAAGAACPPGSQAAYVPYSGASSVAGTVASNELFVSFSPPLENARTYKLVVPAEVTCVPDQWVEVRCLIGDVNSDGRVNTTDRSVVVGVWTGGGYSPATDLDMNGQTNALDRSMVVGAWTGTENCAP